MPTRNVVLTVHQADMVERLVASGRYQNASEVLRDGLRLGSRAPMRRALSWFNAGATDSMRSPRPLRRYEI